MNQRTLPSGVVCCRSKHPGIEAVRTVCYNLTEIEAHYEMQEAGVVVPCEQLIPGEHQQDSNFVSRAPLHKRGCAAGPESCGRNAVLRDHVASQNRHIKLHVQSSGVVPR